MVVSYGLVMGGLSCILHVAGIDLNWLYLLMGLLIGPAVPPVSFCLTWKKASRAGAVSGALSGITTGVVSWLVYAKVMLLRSLQSCFQIRKSTHNNLRSFNRYELYNVRVIT